MSGEAPQDILVGHPAPGVLQLTLRRTEVRNALRTRTLGQPEVNLGLIPGAGGTARLARICGKALTMQMVLTGKPNAAQAALAAGIAVEVDEPGSAIARAIEIAATIATRPPLAVRLAKEEVLRAFEMPLAGALAAERQAFALLAASHDRNEGIAAFLERRSPQFNGR
jgi:enoyl-CoA hydratase